MKTVTVLAGAATWISGVVGHATFQDLWVDGKDQISNINSGPVSGKCTVQPGSTITIEMHQQPGDRSCSTEAIGGSHYGPVLAYLSKVSDSSTADGSAPFFKIFEDTWARASSSSQGSDDYWGTKDLNANCGKMDLTIPADLAPGDYLLRAEAIALHTASSPGGAQFYLTCFQITVGGSGSASPSGVAFPGAYKATDPGIEINIYQQLSTYVAPGPSIVAGGVEAVAGKAGSKVTATGGVAAPTKAVTSTAAAGGAGSMVTSARPAATSAAAGGGACQAVAKYQQCGGTGYSGCTTCESGSTCSKLNEYYSQCS